MRFLLYFYVVVFRLVSESDTLIRVDAVEKCLDRAVVSGGAGGALAPPEFGSSVNPTYSNQRGQIMPTTLLLAPPDSKI